MVAEKENRVIELYQKGVLTKEEAQGCYVDLTGQTDTYFIEEKKPKSSRFSLPSFVSLTASKQWKEEYSFAACDSLCLTIDKGHIQIKKSKDERIHLEVVSSTKRQETARIAAVELGQSLSIKVHQAQHVGLSVPEGWFSILELDLGQANLKVDYLPFEDVTVRSQVDKKQQDVRLTCPVSQAQHLFLQLQAASIHLGIPRKMALKGRIESAAGRVLYNRHKKQTPYVIEETGERRIFLHLRTKNSRLTVKRSKK